jgi:hypothetical protein
LVFRLLRIIVAVDGSEVSRRALERVARFMKEAEVALVTVARPIYRDPRYTGYADPKDEEEQREVLFAARDVLEVHLRAMMEAHARLPYPAGPGLVTPLLLVGAARPAGRR